MFWRMAGLSTASPVETVLDKDNFTLEELLDEDEIIQECKALNARLINFLRGRAQVEQLIRYIVEEAPGDAEKRRTFKFPFISCEIFTCEVDIILKTMVEEDEKLMNLLFSFLDSNRSHSSLLAGYFSKVVICLLLRKTFPFMQYVQAHQDVLKKMVDLIGITSIMEVLIHLVGADEHIYTNYMEEMHWLEETDVLEMIVDKFSSSDSPEVHANAAETLCAITRYSPPGLATKISSPSFVGRIFRHALEDSRPKSVLVNSLSVLISLLDPNRLTLGTYQMYNRQLAHASSLPTNPETVEGMLGSLGELLKLLDVSSAEGVLLTTYGKLQPPLGKNRLKIVEFISVLLTVGSEAAEKELIRLGAVGKLLDMFFEYPFNNFLHHYVKNIVVSCLESKNVSLYEHLLHECNLVSRILEAEKNSTLTTVSEKPTIAAEGRMSPKIGNTGHLTRISNKLIHLGDNNPKIESYLQENSDWVDYHTNVLLKRNTVENVYQWACGRPTSLLDRNRDSDDDDYQDRDYDVAALANNLSQAFRYGIYSNDGVDEAHGSLERDDEDVYFDDESAEVVISSLRLGDDQESSLFTNSNWFALEDGRIANERSTGSLASPSPHNADEARDVIGGSNDDAIVREDDTATSSIPSKPIPSIPEWIEWRETDIGVAEAADVLPNGELKKEPEPKADGIEPSASSLETKPETSPEAETKPETSPEAESQSETSPEAESQSETSPEAESQSETSPEAESQSETSSPESVEGLADKGDAGNVPNEKETKDSPSDIVNKNPQSTPVQEASVDVGTCVDVEK